MKLRDIFSKAEKPLLSVEFFPPKTDKGEENLWTCIQELKPMHPAYVSVTYGAGGTTQDRTRNIVLRIKEQTGLEPVAHLTCVGATQAQLNALLEDYRTHGLDNILALRGDPPEGMDKFEATSGGLSHATDLIEFIHQRNHFSIACATYPEGHPESTHGVADDIQYLKLKQDNGADMAVTQYFFDNDTFFRFRDAAHAAGVTLPIVPGIMPITNFEQIVRFSGMCGASIPEKIHQQMSPIQQNLDDVKKLGIDIAISQCQALLSNGVPGLHFYTLNKSEATLAINREL
ncbi:MAG: methylenetetrahydrofolate reductase [NAD(P)H] [Zetaproteobacteria bacterium CG_4_9_14_3_um_filter_49_83]|nr:MAG: methylenetetrahydrofolate reductase [NAD(P)H] [Zetaproteobacteria bacterium CG1_02_49_23]PIQ32680.1 MAG: methylenetetrahydrofolate reductase [NAD(P)H] [Zetaproteobacteria bacterium CG17_big_fil_post_rev_8_21_14_2_50_50_13]PIV30753.1 MAG: methylenetetrahydrofolate reductase [NAD(P)H] [Zetaproteobacteria bacterium CG02_land_8_20_14_3_00_50_9]PIY55285.1 MAG: methylenetetrahydrofolate reductase [NAD(P)H] [Zetaproteobacteria bacterium CG_4_10_14_0_8_um_filter_49_80]PJA36097.1 MAG: methylenet